MWSGTVEADLDVMCSMLPQWLLGWPQLKQKLQFVCPCPLPSLVCSGWVEDLAHWLADEDLLPKPVNGGAARTELTDDERLLQSVWAEMPMGLRALVPSV